jgi:predicted amidohydrolase YtcJ
MGQRNQGGGHKDRMIMMKQQAEGCVLPHSLTRMIALALAIFAAPATARAQAPETVLVNGKIVTVDDRFTIAQALAIRGGRIMKVGTTSEIEVLKGPATRSIELGGRTVIPGLIDNHAHFIRVAEHWHQETRLDGISSRGEALRMLVERVRAARPGDWIVTLGGWSEEQFTDDARGFPLEELDRIAPDNPIVLQAVYRHSYLNSAALNAAKINAATPDPPGGRIEKMQAASQPASSGMPAVSLS